MNARLIRLLNRLLRRSHLRLVPIDESYTSLAAPARHRNPALVALHRHDRERQCR